MKTATHPVKLYYNELYKKYDELSLHEKCQLLRKGISSLLDIGRVVLSTKYYSEYDMWGGYYKGSYCYRVIYIGRKAVWRKGVRHMLRKYPLTNTIYWGRIIKKCQM